jgi:hypothetical protein
MGLTSLLLRAPAVAIAHAGDATRSGEYQAGAAVLFVLAVVLAAAVAYAGWRDGSPLLAAVALLVLWFIAITWSRALFYGHPEEPFTALVAIAAVVLAARGHPLAAGLALGLAIGSKEWALLAAPAVLFAGPQTQWRRGALAAIVAVAVTSGAMALGNTDSYRAAHREQQRGDTHTVTPASVWFRFGQKRFVAASGDAVAYSVFPPKAAGRWCRPAVIVIALLAAIAFGLRRGFGSRDALALVAFILTVRVIIDTQTFSYHLTPMLMFVAAWEVLGRRRFPLVATLAMIAFQLTMRWIVPNFSADVFNASYLAWTIALATYLGIAAFRRTPAPAPARAVARF